MALSNMYTQQAAEAAHRRKMAEVQGDSKLASIEQGGYDEAMARALDAKFQEDRKCAEDAACTISASNRAAWEAAVDNFKAEKPVSYYVTLISSMVGTILLMVGLIALFS